MVYVYASGIGLFKNDGNCTVYTSEIKLFMKDGTCIYIGD